MDDPAARASDRPPPAAAPGRPGRRSPLRLTLAAAMVLAGLVWIGQGLGILTAARSFMVGDPMWALIGLVVVVGGLSLLWRTTRGTR